MDETIIFKQTGPVLSLMLNRPDCGNLITMEMIGAVTERLRNLSKETRLVVFRGAGTDFCKGRDYKKAPEDAGTDRSISASAVRERMTTPILAMYAAIKELSVPTISVVQGAAAGFGCAFPCSCDIVLAGERARFSLPEMRERGLPPTLAMTALADRVNYRSLSYLVYSSAEIDSKTALSAGLVSVVCRDDELDKQAQETIDAISSRPRESIKAVNRYLKLAPYMEPRGRAELGANLFAIASASR